ncbi:proteophosphoglycan ppg4 [Diplocarpon rosae]|nr:proteophosphoglycan ppg4 [Diplocarpon rosae]
MGNEQSAPASRRAQNKLSKPKTNNNSGANSLTSRVVTGLPSNTAPAPHHELVVVVADESTEGRYRLLPRPTAHSVPGDIPAGVEVEPTRQEKQKRRMSLFRSKSVQPRSMQHMVEFHVEKAVELPAEPSRWSMVVPRGEPTVCEAAPHAIGPQVEMRALYGLTHPRLSLISSMPPYAPEQPAELRSRYEPGETRPPLGRTHSETLLYVPIRRRSLLQHGVATRASPVGAPRHPSTPPARHEGALPNHHHPPALATSSPPAELAPLEQPRDLPPCPRVETPNEMDYGHIGAFKLGTLRITNGAASPSPSYEKPRRAATLGYEDGLGPRSQAPSLLGEGRHSWGEVRAASPLRRDSGTAAAVGGRGPRPQTLARTVSYKYTQPHEHEREFELESPRPPKPVFTALTVDIPDPTLATLALFDFTTDVTRARGHDRSSTPSETAHSDLPKDLALSPFSFDDSPSASPGLHVRDPATATATATATREPLPAQPKARYAGTCSAPSARTKSVPTAESAPNTNTNTNMHFNMALRIKKSLPALPGEASRESESEFEPSRSRSRSRNRPRHPPPAPLALNLAPQRPDRTSFPSPLTSHPVVPCQLQPPSQPQSQSQLQPPSPSPSQLQCRRRTGQNTRQPRVDNLLVAIIPNTDDVVRLGPRRSFTTEARGTIFPVGSSELRDGLSSARLQRPLPPIPHESIRELSTTTLLRGRPAEQLREQPALPVLSYTAPRGEEVHNRRHTSPAPLPNLLRHEQPPTPSNESYSFAAGRPHRTAFSSTSNPTGTGPDTAPRPTPARRCEPSMPETHDSTANPKPYGEQTREPDGRIERPRERIRSYPPQAHARFSIGPTSPLPSPLLSPSRQDSDQYASDDERQRPVAVSATSKQTKSHPPVSMVTQRSVIPPCTGSHPIFDPSTQGLARPDQQPAPHYHAECRQSTGEARTRQGRLSLDVNCYGQFAEAMSASHRSFDAGQSSSGQGKRWNIGAGYEEHAFAALPIWVDGTVRTVTNRQQDHS